MKVMKMEILVLDFEGLDEEGSKNTIENNKWNNVSVKSIKSVDIEWTDDHPLNNAGTEARAYADLFPVTK